MASLSSRLLHRLESGCNSMHTCFAAHIGPLSWSLYKDLPSARTQAFVMLKAIYNRSNQELTNVMFRYN